MLKPPHVDPTALDALLRPFLPPSGPRLRRNTAPGCGNSSSLAAPSCGSSHRTALAARPISGLEVAMNVKPPVEKHWPHSPLSRCDGKASHKWLILPHTAISEICKSESDGSACTRGGASCSPVAFLSVSTWVRLFCRQTTPQRCRAPALAALPAAPPGRRQCKPYT